MKKTRTYESAREEAVRQDALERKGALDDLPFTRLRRYAKEPSQVYAIRIPVSRLQAIRRLAGGRGEQPTALLREWVLERLDEEELATAAAIAREPSTPYRTKSAKKKTTARRKGA